MSVTYFVEYIYFFGQKISIIFCSLYNNSSTEAYIEVLDGSRVHPETYEWARKMAVDALEYDDTAEDANPAGALEEILESPERLKDLDLDAFAEELKRQVKTDLTGLSLVSLLWDIGKQNSPRCDAAERVVPSGAILFA